MENLNKEFIEGFNFGLALEYIAQWSFNAEGDEHFTGGGVYDSLKIIHRNLAKHDVFIEEARRVKQFIKRYERRYGKEDVELDSENHWDWNFLFDISQFFNANNSLGKITKQFGI